MKKNKKVEALGMKMIWVQICCCPKCSTQRTHLFLLIMRDRCYYEAPFRDEAIEAQSLSHLSAVIDELEFEDRQSICESSL